MRNCELKDLVIAERFCRQCAALLSINSPHKTKCRVNRFNQNFYQLSLTESQKFSEKNTYPDLTLAPHLNNNRFFQMPTALNKSN